MSDLIKRLRDCVDYAYETRHHTAVEALNDAADLIEQQQRENESLAVHVENLNKSMLWFIEVIETDFIPDLEDYAELEEEINEAKKLATQSPKTSLAEVKAKQAYTSYLQAYVDAHAEFGSEYSLEEIGVGMEMSAEEHANKVRNGDE